MFSSRATAIRGKRGENNHTLTCEGGKAPKTICQDPPVRARMPPSYSPPPTPPPPSHMSHMKVLWLRLWREKAETDIMLALSGVSSAFALHCCAFGMYRVPLQARWMSERMREFVFFFF